MTARTPSRRLTDVLRSNSKESLLRNATDLARVSASLNPEEIQTRFMRNKLLISPKSLQLLEESRSNFHRVSVESFVEAALRSRDIHPMIQREIPPQDIKIRVVNDVDEVASGPVVVTVADRHHFTRSLEGFTMRYDVLVAGHLPLTEPRTVTAENLFPSLRSGDGDCAPPAGKTGTAAGGASALCACTYQVKRNAYYSVHPVSLVEIAISSPPFPLPPRIELFVREHLGTFVIGDPAANTVAADGSQAAKSSWGVIAMRGDCDFPRVFTHLREVLINTDLTGATGDVTVHKPISFHCRNCFEPVLQRERIYSLKQRRVALLDGSWTPEAEFL